MPIIGQISVGDGATFTPAVDNDGKISWTNNKNLPNPATVDIPQAVMDRYQIAPVNSPAFTGTPTAPTPAPDDDSTKIATTEYVQAELADYLPLSGGIMTGNIFNSSASLFTIGKASSVLNQGVRFWGGGGFENGASLYLYGKSHTNAGQFMLYAHDGTASRALIGTPAGSLTWLGKEIERVNASNSNYIRYESGLQICWGQTSTITTATTVTVTLPASFVNTDYMLAGGRWWVASATEEYYFKDKTTTNFKLVTIGTVGAGNHGYMYIAVGKWK